MGLDLRILPQYSQEADFSHDIIGLHRDSDMFDIISELEEKTGREVPRKGVTTFSGNDESFEGTCYGKITTTPYGDLMKGVLAKELKEVLKDYKTDSWKNKGFIAFLNELPDDLELWLFWH